LTRPPFNVERCVKKKEKRKKSDSNFCGITSLFLDPPEIEVERSWVHSGEGYEAQLVCVVYAEPPGEVSQPNLRKSILYLLRPMYVFFTSPKPVD